MKWKEYLALLFGASTPFTLPSSQSIAADGEVTPSAQRFSFERDFWTYVDPLTKARLSRFAGHSSHSSHASHSSHFSGSGSYGYPATPSVPSEPPSDNPSSNMVPFESAPRATATPNRPSKSEISDMVMKVQLALVSKGYDVGPIDGTLNAQTKAALRQFQSSNGLIVSGYMDLQTLRLLRLVD